VFRFDPELIGMTATRSLVSLMLEVGCISALFYLSDAPQSPALLDLLSLCSYKYVALNIDILVGIIFGATPFWIVFFALAVSTAVFMVSQVHKDGGRIVRAGLRDCGNSVTPTHFVRMAALFFASASHP